MSAEVIPFDFEEQAVRIVMRDEEPWFVAADVCRVLEIGNSRDAVSRLDDDERDMVNLNTVGTTDTIRGNPNATIINESGLYALVLTSRKDQAKRFRKWITSEVLPAIRRHGRYEHPGIPANDQSGDFAGMSFREAELWLQSVREARLTRGTRAAILIWDRSPLPSLSGGNAPRHIDDREGRACLRHLMEHLAGAIAAARDGASEVGEHHLTRHGMRALGEGLFVAKNALRVFEGSPWADAAHRAALLSLPGAQIAGPRTLAGIVTRGVILPWALIDGEAA